jgi:hypothetical protein
MMAQLFGFKALGEQRLRPPRRREVAFAMTEIGPLPTPWPLPGTILGFPSQVARSSSSPDRRARTGNHIPAPDLLVSTGSARRRW